MLSRDSAQNELPVARAGIVVAYDATHIENAADPAPITGTEDDDEIYVPGTYVLVDARGGDDRIIFNGVSISNPPPEPVGHIEGGSGFDTIDLSGISPVTVGTIAVENGYSIGFYAGSQRYSFSGIERLTLGSQNNFIGVPSNNGSILEIWAGDGDDDFSAGGAYRLFGEGGNDSFFISGHFGGGAIEGLIDGGTGTDTLSLNIMFTVDLLAGVARSGDYVYEVRDIENVQAHRDSVVLGDDHANVIEVRALFDGADGAVRFDGRGGADTLRGSMGNDELIGGDGDDILDGGLGTDQLTGGAGNDSFHVDRQDDLVFEDAGGGTDTVISSGNFYLYANIENLTLAGSGDSFGVGNALANTILGNSGSNLLIAGAGDDVVRGGDDVDSLFGESGNDELFGDAGIDYLVGGTGNDTLDGGDDADALYGEDGDDVLIGGSSFSTDILVGGADNDVLRGDSGQGDYDLMDGGAGDDSYYVDTPDDLTFEAADGGIDTVYATINGAGYYLYANVENLVLGGDTPFGVGNELNNRITGSDASNWLLGGAGDDILNGRGGNDVLFGEAGADVFVFAQGTGGDVIGDFTAGTDRIDLSAFGFTSFAQVEAALGENGGTSFLTLGNGDMIVLNGVARSALGAGDFILSSAAQAPDAGESAGADSSEWQFEADFAGRWAVNNAVRMPAMYEEVDFYI